MCFSFKPRLFFLFPSFLGHWGACWFCLSFFCRLKGRFFCFVEFLFDHVGEGFLLLLQLGSSDLYSFPPLPLHPLFAFHMSPLLSLLSFDTGEIEARWGHNGDCFFLLGLLDILMVVF